MALVSICIPTYEMKGYGTPFLRQSFDVLLRQTFKDFNVIISDHSQDDSIRDLCEEYSDELDIRYVRNAENIGNSPANTNNAIRHADGTLIKILFQDDFLFSDTSLQETVDAFDLEKDSWLLSACEHTTDGHTFYRPFYPKYHDKIHLGPNTISSPSVLTIKNLDPLFFDENLVWSMDVEYYKRCYERFGPPKILSTITVVNRAGIHQISQTPTASSLREKERHYILKKYNETDSSGTKILRALKHHINSAKRAAARIIKP